jgi:phosphatidate phosphatase APP1
MIAKDDTVKSETIVIDYKKSAIVFHYKTDGKKSTETYTPDGQKRVTRNMSSGQLTSKASWRDSVLVIESTLDIKVPNVTVVVTGLKPVIDTWTLATDSRTLTHDADDHKEVFVYDRQM